MTKVMVTGASGQLGRLVVAGLQDRLAKDEIAVLVRSDAARDEFAALGLDARQGDYSDPASLDGVFDGVEKLLLISGSEVGSRVPQHLNVITAAKAQGVQHIVYTSLLKADVSPMGLAAEHKATEEALADSGLDITLLRNGWYMENHLMALPQVIAMGQQFGAAREGKFATASRQDFAEAAVAVLTGSGHAGKTYELGGDAPYTLAEFAATVADVAGKQVAYVDMPKDAFAEALVGAGLPAELAGVIADGDAAAAEGWLYTDSGDLSRLIGRATTPLKTAVETALKG